MGKFYIGKFPIGESGATSKTGLALGFCGDSFSASPWGGEFTVNMKVFMLTLEKKQATTEAVKKYQNLKIW